MNTNNSTAFFFDHPLEWENTPQILEILAQKLGATVIQSQIDEHFQFNPPLPKGFDGWVLVSDGDSQDGFEDGLVEIFRPSTDESIFLMPGFAEYSGPKLEPLADWGEIGKFAQSAAETGQIPETVASATAEIVQMVANLGLSAYLLFNKDAHEPFIDLLLDGHSWEEACRINSPKLSIIDWRQAVPKKWVNTVVLHKI